MNWEKIPSRLSPKTTSPTLRSTSTSTRIWLLLLTPRWPDVSENTSSGIFRSWMRFVLQIFYFIQFSTILVLNFHVFAVKFKILQFKIEKKQSLVETPKKKKESLFLVFRCKSCWRTWTHAARKLALVLSCSTSLCSVTFPFFLFPPFLGFCCYYDDCSSFLVQLNSWKDFLCMWKSREGGGYKTLI